MKLEIIFKSSELICEGNDLIMAIAFFKNLELRSKVTRTISAIT